MIRLHKIYAKVIDKVTIEEAPEELNGITGFKFNATECINAGYFPVKFTLQTGNTAVYNLINNEVIQSWVDIDTELYAQNVVTKIRERYSENEELAILRKAYAGIDKTKFNEYNTFCESVKHDVKLEMVNKIN